MQNIKNILIIDTALNGVNICVYDLTTDKYVESYLETVRGQAEQIIPMVQGALSNFSLSFQDLDAIITTVGPGSFTGLRLGISAANSFALALEMPIFGMDTFTAVKLSYLDGRKIDHNFAVILETKRADYYIQAFDPLGAPLTNRATLDFDRAHKVTEDLNINHICGDAVERFSNDHAARNDEAKLTQNKVRLANLALVAIHFKTHRESFLDSSKPIYLRGADISQPKKKLRQVSEC